MSREIKFRAWDSFAKKFKYGRRVLDHYTNFEAYTGLKDKNGKEIYEGDIVDTGEEYGKYKVVFSEFWCGFSFEGGKGRKTRDGTEHPRFSQDWDSVEVIGNIHENPELLGGEE